MSHKKIGELKFEPVTKKHWDDFEALFGERGASGGCWCMWWRLKRSELEKNKGKRNKEAMSNIVNSGEILGILAYLDNKPIAWCSVAPREKYPSLERSKVLKRIDDKPVWSIVCFFIVQYKNHVNLYFFNGTRIDDPKKRLVGTGKGMRHLSFKTVDDIDESYIKKLVGLLLNITIESENEVEETL